MFLAALGTYPPALKKAGSVTMLPCLSVAILPRKVTEVSSAGPEAQGSSTQPKLFLSTCLVTCC